MIFDDREFWDEGEVAVDLADGGNFLEWGDDGGIFWEAEFGTEEDFGGSEDEVAEDIFVLGELALLGIGEAEATPIEDDIGGEDRGFSWESGLKEEGKIEGSPGPRMIGEGGGIDGDEGEGGGIGAVRALGGEKVFEETFAGGEGLLAGFVDKDEASDEEEQDELGTGAEHRKQ